MLPIPKERSNAMKKKVKKVLSIVLAVVAYTALSVMFWLAVFFSPAELGM